MIPRLIRNPAVVALAVLALLGVVAANWAIGVSVEDQGFSWSGAPTEAQLWEVRLTRIANMVPGPAALLAVVAALGILVVGSATERSRQRSTRTMSAAGSARNGAATTVPNSSSSIADALASAPISMSTERE
ncbi:hypothetical protein [Agromyces sp. Soil535]|uniref:hypothetical protein n=1 Tax=Agromyces sp. Soil535 TaxID=1736390 RepID=UPI0006F2DBE9|nr:hypothetical protein [Agromyces sp. Soil535]KRE31413.1 hypothetical protein ASG80_02915 [Agromyces sp. Soil535]